MKNKNSVSREQLIEALSKSVGSSSMGRKEAHQRGMCCKCGGDAKKFKDIPSIREYKITGWCQTCQDDYFGG